MCYLHFTQGEKRWLEKRNSLAKFALLEKVAEAACEAMWICSVTSRPAFQKHCYFPLILALIHSLQLKNYLSNQFSVKFNMILLTLFVISLAKAMFAVFGWGKSGGSILRAIPASFSVSSRLSMCSLFYLWRDLLIESQQMHLIEQRIWITFFFNHHYYQLIIINIIIMI